MAARKGLLLNCGILIGVFFCLAECAHFEFSDGQETCILLDLEAEFNLSMGSQNAAPFSIDGANITSGNSLCGSGTTAAILSLTLFPSNEKLRINFRRDLDLQTVQMSVVLQLDPKKHFENASEIFPFELEDSDDLPIGQMNSSFKCSSEEQMFFNQDPGYSMIMRITNLQVQAYNVVDGQYGEAIVCDKDKLTTSVPETTTMNETTTQSSTMTTVPETTVTNETTTTVAPETSTAESPTTTAQETTTEMPTTSESLTSTEQETTSGTPEMTTTAPKIIPKYVVTDGDTVCIVFQGEIRFNIKYKTNDSEDTEQSILVPENAKSEGQCSVGGDNSTQEFKLKFFDDKWTFSVIIEQDEPTVLKSVQVRALQAEPSYSWKKVELVYVIDDNFINPLQSDVGKIKNVTKDEDEGDFRANGDGSYKCGSGETIELNDDVRMDLGDFQYRAFGQDSSGNFTGTDVAECPTNSGDDDDDDDTLAIVLGSVFGGIALVLIIVVAVCLVRKRQHKDYEVM